MSARSERRRLRREAESAVEAVATRRRRLYLRFRVTLIAIALAAIVGLVALITADRTPRLTLLNQTGGPITAIKVQTPAGELTPEPIADKARATIRLPTPAAPPAVGNLIRVTFQTVEGSSSILFKPIAPGLGAHQIYTALRMPTGGIQIVNTDGPNLPGATFRDLLRSIGLGR